VFKLIFNSFPLLKNHYALILLIISIAVVIKIPAKVFKMGVLMNRRPGIKEIVKMIPE